MQDEILNNLAKIGQLKVICRTSVMQYRADAKRDLHEIAIVNLFGTRKFDSRIELEAVCSCLFSLAKRRKKADPPDVRSD